jgi:hypothetical protein
MSLVYLYHVVARSLDTGTASGTLKMVRFIGVDLFGAFTRTSLI